MQDWLNKIENTKNLEDLENIRLDIFGKKGFLTEEFAKLKDVPNEQKKNLQEI